MVLGQGVEEIISYQHKHHLRLLLQKEIFKTTKPPKRALLNYIVVLLKSMGVFSCTAIGLGLHSFLIG